MYFPLNIGIYHEKTSHCSHNFFQLSGTGMDSWCSGPVLRGTQCPFARRKKYGIKHLMQSLSCRLLLGTWSFVLFWYGPKNPKAFVLETINLHFLVIVFLFFCFFPGCSPSLQAGSWLKHVFFNLQLFLSW